MYESKSYRSASDISLWDAADTANGTIKTFSFAPAASKIPISPFTAMLYRNGLLVANDDGRGNIRGKDADKTEITQAVDLSLRAVPFTLREYPITASFSKKLELLQGGCSGSRPSSNGR
jgi:hypothetical protein